MADDRAQYAIDIAAKLAGGTATIDQIGELSGVLTTGGKDADFFASAMASVDASLKTAKVSSESANSALADGVARYNELEKAALVAAKAAEKAGLQNAGIIPADLHAEMERAKSALEGEVTSLRKLEGAAKLASDEEKRLGDVQKNLVKVQSHVNKSLAEAAEKSGKVKEAIGSIGGPLGGIAQKVAGPIDSFNKLSQAFGESKAASILLGLGLAALVAGVVALSVAAAAGVVQLTAWGVGLADTARNAILANEAFQAAHPALLNYSDAAEQAAASSGLAGDSLRGLATKLEAAKISADDMPAALEAAAIAERALGSGGADKFIEGLKSGVKSVKDLAKATKDQLGGIVAKQMLSLDAQAARFKINIGKTFGGLKIDPLLEGFQTLNKLFDSSTESGRALESLFNGLLQPLVDGFANAMPAIESFFLGVEIGFLKFAIFLKPAIKGLQEAFGFGDSTTEETLASVAKAGEYLAYVIGGLALALGAIAAVVLPVVVIALGEVVLAVTAAGAAIAALVTVGYFVADGISGVFSAISAGAVALWNLLGKTFVGGIEMLTSFVGDAIDIGKNLALGLAQGIANGASAIVSALTGAVTGAIDAAKRLLGIHSPSTVFAEIGDNTVAGYSQGVDAAAPMARASVAEALEPPPVDRLALPASTEPAQLVAQVAPAPTAYPAERALAPESPVSTATQERLNAIDQSSPQAVSRQQSSESAASSTSLTSTDNSKSVSLSNVTFNFEGVAGAEDAQSRFREMLFQVLNGELSQSGATA